MTNWDISPSPLYPCWSLRRGRNAMPLSTGEWIWRRRKTSPGTPQGESKAGAEPSLPLGTVSLLGDSTWGADSSFWAADLAFCLQSTSWDVRNCSAHHGTLDINHSSITLLPHCAERPHCCPFPCQEGSFPSAPFPSGALRLLCLSLGPERGHWTQSWCRVGTGTSQEQRTARLPGACAQ